VPFNLRTLAQKPASGHASGTLFFEVSPMNQFRLLPLLLLISSNLSHAEAAMFIKAGSIYCPEQFQDDLIEILDAESEHQLKRAVGVAIASGSCVPASIPHAVVNVLKKTTPAGNVFYCFNHVDIAGNPKEMSQCSPVESLTLVAEEKRQRTGKYEITMKSDYAIKATCKEGGYVMIHKGEPWTRISMVLPGRNFPTEKAISQNPDHEIREGCKGVDSED
jgi:hypothetical protein